MWGLCKVLHAFLPGMKTHSQYQMTQHRGIKVLCSQRSVVAPLWGQKSTGSTSKRLWVSVHSSSINTVWCNLLRLEFWDQQVFAYLGKNAAAPHPPIAYFIPFNEREMCLKREFKKEREGKREMKQGVVMYNSNPRILGGWGRKMADLSLPWEILRFSRAENKRYKKKGRRCSSAGKPWSQSLVPLHSKKLTKVWNIGQSDADGHVNCHSHMCQIRTAPPRSCVDAGSQRIWRQARVQGTSVKHKDPCTVV